MRGVRLRLRLEQDHDRPRLQLSQGAALHVPRVRQPSGSLGEAPQRGRMSDWRDEWRDANRANWDERVPIHASGEFYDVSGFKAGQERLRAFEILEVGDVTGKDLV